MSKPVSNAEIEDVLSSIRRLVSENAGAHRRDRSGAQGGDRLVLTPAFRVDDSSPYDADVLSGDDAGGEATPDPAVQEAADDAPAAEARAEDMDADMDAAVAILAERLTAANIIPDHAETPDPGATDTPDAAEDAVAEAIADDAGAPSLERRIAELEAAVDDTADEWEPDGSEAEDMPDKAIFHHHARPAATEPATEPVQTPWDSTDEGQPEAASGPAGEPDQAADNPQAGPMTDDGIATPGESLDDETPDETPHAAASDSDPWEDVVFARPDDAHAFGGDDIDDAEVLEEESVIDEAILRDYVAQMVREELQGPIGERITHNVRRMVRREIARALALRDMD